MTPNTKINSKWIRDLNVRDEAPRRKHKLSSPDIGIGNDFCKAKAQMNKWYYIKLNSFCRAKETIKKMKKQPTEWEKVSANHISAKGLVPQI